MRDIVSQLNKMYTMEEVTKIMEQYGPAQYGPAQYGPARALPFKPRYNGMTDYEMQMM